jgi:restriction endonuclease S subunit
MILPGFKGTTSVNSVVLDAAVGLVFRELLSRFTSEKLGNLAEIGSGGTPSRANSLFYQGEIPWVKISDMTNAGKFIADTEEHISQQAIVESSTRLFPSGTVLFSMYGSIGKTAITLSPLTTNQAILGLNPKGEISKEYLYYSLISARMNLFSQSKGTTQRNINAGMVKDYVIPVPPVEVMEQVVHFLEAVESEKPIGAINGLPDFLEEQRRIVARVESLAAQIAEARGLRESVVAQANQLCRSFLVLESNNDFVMTPMKELVSLRPPDVHVQATEQYHFAGVYCFGRGMFKSVTKYGSEFSYPKLSRVKAGDFTYPKLMAWEGALSVVPSECDGLVVSTEFPVFTINTTRVLPEVLDVYFKTPSVWEAVAGTSTGTNARRRRLNPSDFLEHLFPLPSMETQLKIQWARKVAQQILQLQEATRLELEALLPSVLSKAFAGEL